MWIEWAISSAISNRIELTIKHTIHDTFYASFGKLFFAATSFCFSFSVTHNYLRTSSSLTEIKRAVFTTFSVELSHGLLGSSLLAISPTFSITKCHPFSIRASIDNFFAVGIAFQPTYTFKIAKHVAHRCPVKVRATFHCQ